MQHEITETEAIAADWAERAAAAVILGECQESAAETESFLALTAEDAVVVRREFWEGP